MAYKNNNKKIHDTPIWVPTNQFRTATNALSSMTSSKDTLSRYIYYLSGSLFYRYDTFSDSHQKLASPPVAAVTASCIRYTSDDGYRGNCLGANISGITIAGLNNNILVGESIKIIAGVGIGQERIISATTCLNIKDTGFATTATNVLLTDTTKRWEINQYIGYQVRIVYGTGSSQVRKILYNDSTTLYFYDINYQQLECWSNTPFSASAPYAVPVSTAGSQPTYFIESSDLTIDTPWVTTPDESSSYLIRTGGVYMLSALATAPWSSFQYYDVLTDTWTQKTALGGNLLAALGTDFDLTIMTKETAFDNGIITSYSGKTFEKDRYVNYELRILDGNGVGQKNRIVSNGIDYIETEKPFLIQPDSGSTYEIRPETKMIYAVGNGSSSMYKYSMEYDAWFTGPNFDFGQVRNAAVQFYGQEAQAILTGVVNLSGITVLNSSPINGGSGYTVGDLFNITTTGTIGKGRVETVSEGGVVTSVSLYSAGINYSVGTKSTTIISGSGNNALTVNVTSIGKVGRITTVGNTNYYKDDLITITGCNESAWNLSYNILAIDSLNTFDILISANSNITASYINSTTLIVDSTKNWVINEHIGKIIKLDIAGYQPTSQFRRIISNTQTTITVSTITSGLNGTSRYVICGPEAFGRDRQYKAPLEDGDGRATSGTPTTLTDSNKLWAVNQWAGYKVRIIAGTGVGSEINIISNNTTTLTLNSPGFTPDTTTKYYIMCSFGSVTGNVAVTTLGDSTKNWKINQWAGKRVVITSGLGQRQELTIASNTSNILTFSSGVAPDTTSTYTILAVAPRSTGICLKWIFGGSNNDKGKYLISPRGGGTTTIDRYDLTNDLWDYSRFYTPHSETLIAGSSYAYDGVDGFYYSIGILNDFIYIHKLDVVTMHSEGAFQTTVIQGTAHVGNLLEIVSSTDGGKFIFLGVCTSRLMYKTLIE